MKKVLIVTYYWPPGAGAGVQRWLKFAKYLPSQGWKPIILTVDPAYAAFPANDESLLNEISTDLEIHKTKARDWFRVYMRDKTKIPSAGFASNDIKSFGGKIIKFIRGNFFIPDPRRGWNRFAFRKACSIIDSEEIKHVITTSPPHSTQLIGLAIKKKYPELKWIADLRDPWTDIYYYDNFYHTVAARKIDENYEKKILRTADKIITIGNSLKENFCSKVPGIEDKIEIITNGFDEDDFKEISHQKPSIFTISYIGTLSDAYPISGVMKAVENLSGKGYEVKLRFVGSVSSGQRTIISSKASALKTEFIPYVKHSEAINYMTDSSLLLLIIPDHRSNKSIITGKLFEYLASGRPILCIGPKDGDAADIINRSGGGKCAAYNEEVGICQIIDYYYKGEGGKGQNGPLEFTRESLTKKLVLQLGNNKT